MTHIRMAWLDITKRASHAKSTIGCDRNRAYAHGLTPGEQEK